MILRCLHPAAVAAVVLGCGRLSVAALTGQYLFEEGSGAVALDSSSFGRDGALTDAAGTGAPQYAAGLYRGSNFALSFDKNLKHRVALPQNADFIRNSPGATLMAWIQIEDRMPDPENPENFFTTIVQVNNTDVAAFNGFGGARAAISNSLNHGFRSIGSVANEPRNGLSSFSFPEIGAPFFAVGVFDYVNGTNTMYVNGVQVAQNIVPGWNGLSADEPNLHASIGASADPAAASTVAFHGVIDGVRIFDEALSAETILNTYNAEVLPDLPDMPGDFDLDADVDADDLAQWRADFGPSGGSDADADGDSDGADLLIWQRNLTGSLAAVAVPEPGFTPLMLLVAGALVGRRRSCNHNGGLCAAMKSTGRLFRAGLHTAAFSLVVVWQGFSSSRAAFAQSPSQAPPTYEVGLAKVDVTPEYPIRLSGFSSRKEPSEGVRQPIFARAMAVCAEGEPAVLVTVDSIGIPIALRDEVARRLHAKRNLDPHRLAICVTHSHTTPALTGVLPTMFGAPVPPEHQARIDQYTRELTDRIEEAALAALDDLKPSRLSFGMGSVDFAINRRTRGGPVDHDLPVMSVTAPDGTLRGLYVGYACHCVVLSDNKISGDWAGYAAKQLEQKYPGAVALVSIGCGADSNPASGVTGDKAEVAQRYAADIVAEVDRLLNRRRAEISGKLQCELNVITLPLAAPAPREHWVEHSQDEGPDGYYARVQLAKIDRGERLTTEVKYPIQTWKFGDSLAMVFLPGEVVVDYSLRLKREFDADRLWVNAYANDSPAYIPSERVLKEGGYEGGEAMRYYGLPAWFAPGLEDKIISTVGDLLGEEFKVAERSDQGAAEPGAGTNGVPPKSPAESLAALQVAPGLRVELMASEPLVRDPVAIDFGPDGKLWVAEMQDYGCKEGEECLPQGRITVLEDRDGDGRFDSSRAFLENISCPMGVTVWRDGVLICAAPDILYAEDTTGDGRADVVEKLFSGFGTQHPQARVNGFAAGLDGWLYAACSFGGNVHNHRRDADFSHPDSDFRLQPDTGVLEPETGRTQQSRVRDDWGNWFGCNNSVLCWHYPLSERYLRRNPHVAPPNLSVSVASPSATQLFPRGELVLWELSGPPGRPTAACGLGVYRDDVLGAEFANNVFTCEPVNQLVHRMVLKPSGATFVGERPATESDSEFLTSTDNWFRPVQIRTGPDGALWIVDMYRYVIEHSRWVPQADLDRLDVRAGSDLGRIYRVVPRDGKLRPQKRLGLLDTHALAEAIDSPNGWQRDMVQQMLLWRDDDAAIAPLVRLAEESPRATTRLQALCTLAGLGALPEEILVQTLSDVHPGVRRHAVRLTESRLNQSPEVAAAALELIDDPDASVALQLACSLGKWGDPRSVSALADIALRRADDPYVLTGVLTSVSPAETSELIAAVLGEPTADVPVNLVEQLMELAGAVDDRQTVHAALGIAADRTEGPGPRRFAALAAFVVGLNRNAQSLGKLLDPASTARLAEQCRACAAVAADAEAELATRIDCIRVLGSSPRASAEHIAALGSLLTAEHDPHLQSAALDSLALINNGEVAAQLVEQWSGLSPGIRLRALDVLLSREAWVRSLLEALESGAVQAADIDAAHRAQLSEFPNEELRQLAARHFAGGSSDERAAVFARYQGSLPSGDAARGEALYRKHCANCHQFRGIGEHVGPDLGAVEDRSGGAMLREILDPNRAVDQRYAEYLALTIDGLVKKGVLVEESGNAITLRGLQGEETTLLRRELESLTTAGKSLMPEGFEKELSRQDMADLLQFLASP